MCVINLSSMEEVSPKDWVLIFLSSGFETTEDEPSIQGWLMFTKQFFVFVKEVKKELDAIFNFVPYDYGPYSFILQEDVEELVSKDYIKVINNGDRKDYFLTEKGREKAEECKKSVPDKTLQTISNLRKEATQLGYSGILRYVYTKYPEYTSASKIKEKVLNG